MSAKRPSVTEVFSTDAPTTTAHWLNLTIDRGWLTAEWRCPHNYPARCWSFCPRSECEEGCTSPDLHEQEKLSYCNVTTWLSDESWDDEYVGAVHAVRGGWIEPRWTGDGYGWVYLDEASASAGSERGGA